MGSCFSSPKSEDLAQGSSYSRQNGANADNSARQQNTVNQSPNNIDSSAGVENSSNINGNTNGSGTEAGSKRGSNANSSKDKRHRHSSGTSNGTANGYNENSVNGSSGGERSLNGSNSDNANYSNQRNGSIASPTSMNAPNGQSNNSSGGKNSNKDVKILLLGSGESGKSTVLKQMKIIHQNGYSQEELLMYKTTVYKNLLDCAKAIVVALKQFDLSLEPELPHQHSTDGTNNNNQHSEAEAEDDDTFLNDHEHKPDSSLVTEADLEYITSSIISPDPDTVLDPDLALIIKHLWAHPTVRKMFGERRSEFYIMDSAPYFFDNVDRIGDSDYIPNVADILRARIKTTGIYETRFEMGGLNILMYDVGGQRSERKKWIHCFDNVTVIIFCVALSEYDQVLLEEKSQNRMAESLVLFDSVINSRWFSQTSVVLFLNKIDVFTEKLPHSPLQNYFPDYSGGADVNKAAKYILWRFDKLNRAHLNIYAHLTQATDTSNIRLVFAAVKETILHNALRDTGLL